MLAIGFDDGHIIVLNVSSEFKYYKNEEVKYLLIIY